MPFPLTHVVVHLAPTVIGAMFAAFVVAGPAHAGFSLSSLKAACKCETLRSALTAEDVAEIEKLPAQILATIATAGDRATMPADANADVIAAKIADDSFDGGFDRITAGTRACTVYWYGFLDNRSERVGRHQCKISKQGDAISVSKISGDRLTATLVPYVPGAEVFIGRTFLAGQKNHAYDKSLPANPENENYGNKVGLALADRGKLYLLSINERGFTEPDPIPSSR